MPRNPTTERGAAIESTDPREVDVLGDLVLAVPPKVLGGLVQPEVARARPSLKRSPAANRADDIARSVFQAKDPGAGQHDHGASGFELHVSLLDNSQVWSDQAGKNTALNVISSNADLIVDYPNEVILDIVLKELRRFLEFTLGPPPSLRTSATMMWITAAAMFKPMSARNSLSPGRSWDNRPRRRVRFPNLFLADIGLNMAAAVIHIIVALVLRDGGGTERELEESVAAP